MRGYTIRSQEDRNRIANFARQAVIVNAPGNNFDPSTITGQTLWLRGDYGTYSDTGLTTLQSTDAGLVKGWKDYSSGSRNQTNNVTCPKLAANAQNGKNVLRFADSNGLLLDTSISLSSYITNSAYTYFIVFRYSSISSNNAAVYQNESPLCDQGDYFGTFLKSGSGGAALAYNWDGNSDSISAAMAADTFKANMVRHEAGNLYFSQNAGSESSIASGNTAALTNYLRIGNSSNASYQFKGDIAEIIIYNVALSALDIAQIYAYLNYRWSLY